MTSIASDARPRLRRDRPAGWIAGVSAGIARRYGLDPALVRLGFVIATAAGGAGIALYLLLWLVVPAGDAPAARRRVPAGARASVEVALGSGLLLLSVLLTFRALGIWFSDAIVWPLVLIGTGGVLIWRQSTAGARAPAERPEPKPEPVEAARSAAVAVSRTGIGIALVIAAGIAFLQATGALSAARDVVLAVFAVVVVLCVILAPWIIRLVRSLASERAERIRSQERAEVAAHLHDSVLQTLAMVQRRSSNPREVAALARRQERELRAWLAGRPAPAHAESLGAALEAAAADVEERHGVPVEVVAVGDVPLDPDAEAVVAAAREAMTNAAKFGAGSTVDVFAEASAERLNVFVRDRGPGFDTAAVPPDRRGVSESIVGRMRRHGGRATISSAPGSGTEVELVLER
ncbi:MAG: PspC domain-containing protein [Thermoleophilaceae bacterium]|nr:PspC domain-containing protein [Thermoleophilaceae bacterium]